MFNRLKKHLDLVLILLIGGLFVVGLVGWLLLSGLEPKPASPLILDRLGELDVRVGDSAEVLEQIPNQLVNEESQAEYQIKRYASTKNPNLLVTFLIFDTTIIEIEYPVLIEEEATIDTLDLPDVPATEYWDNERANTKVRVFPTHGLAVSYHAETRLAYNLYQFYPSQTEAFLLRHPEITTQQDFPDHDDWDPNMFATQEAETAL